MCAMRAQPRTSEGDSGSGREGTSGSGREGTSSSGSGREGSSGSSREGTSSKEAGARLLVAVEQRRGANVGTALRCAVAFRADAFVLVGSNKYSTHGAHGE
jgi:hypothetical protein